MNPKIIVGSSIVGFVISFLVGIISGNTFGTVLLRAVISSVCFAGLYCGGSFIYKRFLDMKTFESEEKDSSESTVVDLSADDDALPEDNGPGFFLDNSRKFPGNVQPVTSGVQKDASQVAAVSENGSSETQNFERENTLVESEKEKKVTSLSDDSLDELPEITGFSSENTESGETEDNSNMNSEASFIPKDLNEVTGFQDSNVMAQAIRTILSKDG